MFIYRLITTNTYFCFACNCIVGWDLHISNHTNRIKLTIKINSLETDEVDQVTIDPCLATAIILWCHRTKGGTKSDFFNFKCNSENYEHSSKFYITRVFRYHILLHMRNSSKSEVANSGDPLASFDANYI